jgi:hypothetical protein
MSVSSSRRNGSLATFDHLEKHGTFFRHIRCNHCQPVSIHVGARYLGGRLGTISVYSGSLTLRMCSARPRRTLEIPNALPNTLPIYVYI